MIHNARRGREDKIVWSRPEQPIEERVPESFLFGCKRMFTDWDFNKKIVKVDKDNLSLSIDDELVVKASTASGKLKLDWQGVWKAWDELQTSSELSALIEKANQVLAKSGGKKKGLGKGSRTM